VEEEVKVNPVKLANENEVALLPEIQGFASNVNVPAST
jgi:hypothetical protein